MTLIELLIFNPHVLPCRVRLHNLALRDINIYIHIYTYSIIRINWKAGDSSKLCHEASCYPLSPHPLQYRPTNVYPHLLPFDEIIILGSVHNEEEICYQSLRAHYLFLHHTLVTSLLCFDTLMVDSTLPYIGYIIF